MILETLTKCETEINVVSKEIDELVKLIDPVLVASQPSVTADVIAESPQTIAPLEERIRSILWSAVSLTEKIKSVKSRVSL